MDGRTSFEHFLLAKIRRREEIVISVSWFYLLCSAHDLTCGERESDFDRGFAGGCAQQVALSAAQVMSTAQEIKPTYSNEDFWPRSL